MILQSLQRVLGQSYRGDFSALEIHILLHSSTLIVYLDVKDFSKSIRKEDT